MTSESHHHSPKTLIGVCNGCQHTSCNTKHPLDPSPRQEQETYEGLRVKQHCIIRPRARIALFGSSTKGGEEKRGNVLDGTLRDSDADSSMYAAATDVAGSMFPVKVPVIRQYRDVVDEIWHAVIDGVASSWIRCTMLTFLLPALDPLIIKMH